MENDNNPAEERCSSEPPLSQSELHRLARFRRKLPEPKGSEPLGPAAASTLEAHVSTCVYCRRQVEKIERAEELRARELEEIATKDQANAAMPPGRLKEVAEVYQRRLHIAYELQEKLRQPLSGELSHLGLLGEDLGMQLARAVENGDADGLLTTLQKEVTSFAGNPNSSRTERLTSLLKDLIKKTPNTPAKRTAQQHWEEEVLVYLDNKALQPFDLRSMDPQEAAYTIVFAAGCFVQAQRDYALFSKLFPQGANILDPRYLRPVAQRRLHRRHKPPITLEGPV